MNKLKVVKRALTSLINAQDEWGVYHFYSCHLLQSAALMIAYEEQGSDYDFDLAQREVEPLQAEYASLFDDATFWIETRAGHVGRDTWLRPPHSECNFDRACCLMMFAEMLRYDLDA